MKKQLKCYIYTRVSTAMQVDGFSLDAQKDKLKKYADYQEMSIVGEYSDEGKSGKSVEGRPEFQQMLKDIETCTALFYVIGNCDAISYYIKTRPEDAQTAEMELIAAQYRGRARVLQAKLFVIYPCL